jgi:hypothetical protein
MYYTLTQPILVYSLVLVFIPWCLAFSLPISIILYVLYTDTAYTSLLASSRFYSMPSHSGLPISIILFVLYIDAAYTSLLVSSRFYSTVSSLSYISIILYVLYISYTYRIIHGRSPYSVYPLELKY